MPSPKAVLRDIKDLGLDPKKAYRETTNAGRLLGKAPDKTAPRHLGAVAPPPKPAPAESPKVEEAAPVVAAEAEVPAEPKKNKPPKRTAAKKDEPEEPPVS